MDSTEPKRILRPHPSLLEGRDYVPADRTDIRVTWERARREAENGKQQQQTEEEKE